MTRSQAVAAALRREVERHAAAVDADTGLVTVTVTVKLVAGTVDVRGVEWTEGRLTRASATG